MPTKKKVSARPRVTNILQIKNFKSVLDVQLSPSRVNVLFGRPNSGKSNILEALTLFNFIQPKTNRLSEATLIRYNTLDNLFYDRNLSNDIVINYNSNNAILSYYSGANTFLHFVNPEQDFIKKKSKYFEEGLSLNEIQSKGSILPKVQNPQKYSSLFSILNQDGQGSPQASNGPFKENPIRKYEFKDGLSYSDPFRSYLKPFGENLFTIVQDNPKIKEWITRFFEEFNLEFLLDFSSKKFEIQKKENGIVYKIPFELTPDTLRRMLFYVAAIYSNHGSTILFEEPEAHAFPPYVKELSELIKADNDNKYFITTHSPYFLNSLIEDSLTVKDISFFHVYYENYQTKVRKLTQKELDVLWGASVDVFFNVDSLSK